MTRTHTSTAPSSQVQAHPHWELVERIAASQCFHASNRLRDFLYYVCDCALREAPEEATEQQIGMNVFQRQPGYNSSEDSIVRTHARGLRQKLLEYFSNEGLEEKIVIEIPKGHYLPVFRARASSPILPPSLEPVVTPAPSHPKAFRKAGKRGVLWAGMLALLLVCGLGVWGFTVRSRQQSPVERFWAPFFSDNGSLVIYSNALFVGDSTNGLRYAPAATRSQPPDSGQFVATYTGIGELTSVYDLTRLFDAHHASFTLKRNLLVTWDEAKLSNLIFIGSVAENSSLRELPSTMDFTLMAGNGYAGIVNHHPRPGELALYARPEHPFTKDYAILALLPGLQGDRKLLLFSGLTTFGTQSAVEFACRKDTLEQLFRVVSGPSGRVRPFEAVLETSIAGSVPLQARIVALHLR